MIRYVIRPEGITVTPTLLAHDLGVQTRRWPANQYVPDFGKDFFLTYPNIQGEIPSQLYKFFSQNKAGQRTLLHNLGINVPRTYLHPFSFMGAIPGKYVVRPLRHHGGAGYRITDNSLDFSDGAEYISEFYPKKREYRIIFVYGKPVVTLRKKPNEGVGNDLPWGHVNSTFQTIVDISDSKLKTQTDCYEKLSACPVIKHSHIVAVDVMWSNEVSPNYTILEFNTCPALEIDSNRAAIVAAIKAHHEQV